MFDAIIIILALVGLAAIFRSRQSQSRGSGLGILFGISFVALLVVIVVGGITGDMFSDHKFGKIREGMSKAAVFKILGEPTWSSDAENAETGLDVKNMFRGQNRPEPNVDEMAAYSLGSWRPGDTFPHASHHYVVWFDADEKVVAKLDRPGD